MTAVEAAEVVIGTDHLALDDLVAIANGARVRIGEDAWRTIDDGAARLDRPPRVPVEADVRAVRDRDEVVEREIGGPDHDVCRACVGHAGLSSSTHRLRHAGAGNGSAQ